MEYPALLFDSINDKGKHLFWITAHEIGHTLLSDDGRLRRAARRRGWTRASTPSSTSTSPTTSRTASTGPSAIRSSRRAAATRSTRSPPCSPTRPRRRSCSLAPTRCASAIGHPVSYFKSALGLVLLREQILGPERFDPAFRKFIRDWAYKHPSPSDFFRAMESEGGEDLSLVLARLVFQQLDAGSGNRRRAAGRR